MSTIGGKKRESSGEGNFKKFVGLFEAKVIAINPSAEEYKEVLGMELKEDSKALEYLGTSREDDNTTLRVDVWMEEIKNGDKFKATFFSRKQRKRK